MFGGYVGNIFPEVVTPTVQASNVSVNRSVGGLATVTSTGGNGTSRIIVFYPDVVTNPSNGTTYAANAAYGSGDALGTGFVVYSGTGTGVSVTNLATVQDYTVKVFEANGTVYNTSDATNNPRVSAGIVMDMYPSTDRALSYGSGAKDYEAFGGFIFLSNGRMVIVYHKGSAHNPGDADICFKISDDDGVTLSAEVILSAQEANLNKTNPNVSVGDNDRVMFSWTEIPIGPDLGNPTSVKSVYSDDLDTVAIGSVGTATFSSEFTFGQTFGAITFEYIDGPGKAIRAADGSYLKPIWVNGILTVQPQIVACYRSTDNMATFTYYSVVINDTANPCDETCFILLFDGSILAGIRCNTLHKFRYCISETDGLTWGATTTTSIDCIGKPAGLEGPNGVIAIINRDWSTGSAILIQSNDNAASFTSALIDARACKYVYGDGGYHATYGIKFLWWNEARNSPDNQGPTILISKTLVESETPVSPPTVYDPDYQSVIDFATAAAETLPNATLRGKHNTLVAALRTASKLTIMDVYYVAKHNDATLSAFSQRNWRRAWITAVLGGAPTYGVNGFGFDGVDDYLRLNIILSQQTNFQQDSASFTYYSDTTGTGNVAGGVSGGTYSTLTNATAFNPDFANDSYGSLNNDGQGSVPNGGTPWNGLWELDRSNPADFIIRKNGTSLGTISIASTGVVADDLYIGARKFVDGTFDFSTRGVGLVGIGASKASWQTEWAAYVASL